MAKCRITILVIRLLVIVGIRLLVITRDSCVVYGITKRVMGDIDGNCAM